jgi:micrococcal nuclease
LQWTGTVLEVYDGDTMRISRPPSTFVWIRLGRIDCPELGQPGADAARRATQRLVDDGVVRVTVTDPKVIGRTGWYRGAVGDVVLADGRDLAAELVQAGLAWADTDHWDDARVAHLEQDARSSGRGIWAKRGAVPPWRYRSEHPRPLRRLPHPTQFDDLTLPPPGTIPPKVHSIPP